MCVLGRDFMYVCKAGRSCMCIRVDVHVCVRVGVHVCARVGIHVY